MSTLGPGPHDGDVGQTGWMDGVSGLFEPEPEH